MPLRTLALGVLFGEPFVTTEIPPTPVASHRLNKRVAFEQGCSRTDAEALILGGWVQVDGRVVELPQERVYPKQTVTVKAGAKVEPLQPVTLVWHKPAGVLLPEAAVWPDPFALDVVGERQRWKQDPTQQRWVRAHIHKLMAVSPLAELSSGLMVLTQREGVARKATDRWAPLEDEWLVEVAPDKRLKDPDERESVLRSLKAAVSWHDEPLDRARASWQSELRLRLAIHGTRLGQVAYLCERAKLSITAVRRQRMGRVSLAGLPVGQWRYLAPQEKL